MATASKTTISVGAVEIRFLVDADDSGGSATVFECMVPANAKVPAQHSHDGFEETIYGLEGTSVWTVDGHEVPIGPGDSVCIARGSIHGFENRGESEARVLAIASPGVFGPSYFEEMSDVLGASAGGPPDLAAVVEVMRRHGLTPATPVSS
jgi:quercetin dioxygenase-like cupin family protein